MIRLPSIVGAAGWVLLVATDAAAAAWWKVEDSAGYQNEAGQTIRPRVVAIDLKQASLRVVSVPFEAKPARASGDLSLRAFGDVLSRHPRYRAGAWVAVNGGFSSYAVDMPLGLLVAEGRVYSTLAMEPAEGDASPAGSEFGRLRWGGVLCQRKVNGPWEILAAARYKPNTCWQALQAGPVLVEPDYKVGIAASEPARKSPYRRTALCLVDAFSLKVVLTEQDTHLLPLARWLARPAAQGGLGCRSAINLSGDSSSGIAIKPAPRQGVRFLGEGSFPIPTALVFENRAP